MGAADAIIFALLAVTDLTVLIFLRWKRWKRIQSGRLTHSLSHYVRRELTGEVFVRPRWQLRRAS
jgi:hypothetical protein